MGTIKLHFENIEELQRFIEKDSKAVWKFAVTWNLKIEIIVEGVPL